MITMNGTNKDPQALLNEVVLEHLREQKRRRRWRWAFRFIILLLLILVAYKVMHAKLLNSDEKSKPHVGVIDIEGAILDGQSASADNFAKSLNEAYKNSSMKALIIRINSPGGSPVQADYMYNVMHYYRSKHPDIKTYAVCVDLCASAAYYVAASTDEIYANPASMVGSIGVIFNGFGFVGVLDKLGVSRRVQTAGSNKDFLDPFSPEKPKQQQILQTMLDQIHQRFIERVREGRGTRLKENATIFSGLFWTGVDAKRLGLIDGYASAGQLARDTIKVTRMVDYSYKDSVFEKFARGVGSAAAKQLPIAFGITPGLQ